jgi:hypothetical protein
MGLILLQVDCQCGNARRLKRYLRNILATSDENVHERVQAKIASDILITPCNELTTKELLNATTVNDNKRL